MSSKYYTTHMRYFLLVALLVSSAFALSAPALAQTRVTPSPAPTIEASPSPLATESAQVATPAAEVVETLIQKEEKDITQTTPQVKGRLARLLDTNPIGEPTWHNFIQHAIRNAVDQGVAANVQRMKNTIGYVEYAYALQNKMASVQMKNRDGQFVVPGETSFKAAAANAQWDKAPGFYEILTDEPGKESWPISGATFILMHKMHENPDMAREVLKFFDWAYTNGGKLAADLDYVPLPENVQNLIRKAWKNQIRDTSGSSLTK